MLLDPDMVRLLNMGLYNPRNAHDAPTHALSHSFRFAASLSVQQLRMIDSLGESITDINNDLVREILVLKEDREEHLHHIREAVCIVFCCYDWSCVNGLIGTQTWREGCYYRKAATSASDVGEPLGPSPAS